jgi:hypothetical protein
MKYEVVVVSSHLQMTDSYHTSVNIFPSSGVINHMDPTLLLYEVTLKDGEGRVRAQRT